MAVPKLAHRSPRENTPPVLTKPIPFFPAKLSAAEIEYLLEHLEEPPTVALQGDMPDGVNPVAIEMVLVPMYELEQLRLHRNHEWAGFNSVRDVLVRYQAWDELSRESKAMGGPRHPSMHSWDTQGIMTKATPGTDSSEIVRTEILDDGTRRPLWIEDLRRPVRKGAGPRLPWLRNGSALKTEDNVLHDDVKGLLTCSVCDHTVTYSTARGRTAMNMARGQMARHLKSTKKEPGRHRTLYRKEFR